MKKGKSKGKEESFLKIRTKTILLVGLIILVIVVLLVAVNYLPIFTGEKIKSGEQAREEIRDISEDLEDLRSNLESISDELK